MRTLRFLPGMCALMMAFACKSGGDAPPPVAKKKVETPPPVEAPPPPKTDQVDRQAFNRLAAELALPLFWSKDDGNKTLDPAELAVLWRVADTSKEAWVADGKFSPQFYAAYAQILERKSAPAPAGGREALIIKELSQGRPTLIHSDFSGASAEDKAIVKNIMEAAILIEKIHAKQNGVDGMMEKIPSNDPASRMVFYRNQGPWCVAPETENEKACSAIAEPPKKISGLYPRPLQEKNDKFCETLSKHKDADKLMHQFHVVVDKEGQLTAVPYTAFFKTEMDAIAGKLEAAAGAITTEGEAAFKTYLLAAAKAFRDNQWEAADEAWAKMNVNNSKWYLRIGPDEVYFEPCSRKAGFHVSFALINKDSLEWQNKLGPVKQEMEKALAKLAGRPYRARKVDFHLPDFIDIVLNAGDSRSPHGATIGQSLPNWGPVANEGRGRTVAMTNLYTDPDSRVDLETQAKSILCAETMKSYTRDPTPQVMSTVLHEAAHNLGPAHEYKVKGKTASQIFGGPMASTMEELKAQTAALYFTDWLAEKKLIDKKMADQAHVRDIVWGFGHISRGMYTASGKPKAYSQLAAIQLLALQKAGAVEWKAEEKAANGTDTGCLEIKLDKMPKAIAGLMKRVARIKGRGDKKGAFALRKEFVDAEGDKKKLRDTIQERWLRAPKASFVYAVDL